MKKYWIGIIVLILVVVGVWLSSQYSSRIPKAKNHLYQEKITIGMETWPGYLALIVARDKGYFQQAGLDVEIKRYVALGELSKDYVAGKMQGRANLTLDAVNEHLSGLDHKVVLAIDYSNGSDAIMARNDIKTVKDFQGKKVGFESNTLEEFFLAWALNENNMKMSDIVSVSAGPSETPKLLKDGAIDVAVSHEPFISELSSSGNFHKAFSSAEAPGLITDILTFRTNFVNSNPETIQTIVDVYFKALKFWKDNPDEANAIVAKEFTDTPEGIAEQLKGITMLDEQDNQTAFTFAAGFQSLYGNMRLIADFVKQHRAGDEHNIDTDKLIDRRFIKAVNK